MTNETLLRFLSVVGTIETISLILIFGYAFWLWGRGIYPVLYRLGNGLANRKIAIFAIGDNRSSLKSLLLDSDLFKEKNIIEIGSHGDIGKAEGASVYLVLWGDWVAHVDKILDQKPDKCALVVYAPFEGARIPTEDMRKLDGKRHTAVTNFRGRLLNDILTSIMTTHYEKK